MAPSLASIHRRGSRFADSVKVNLINCAKGIPLTSPRESIASVKNALFDYAKSATSTKSAKKTPVVSATESLASMSLLVKRTFSDNFIKLKRRPSRSSSTQMTFSDVDSDSDDDSFWVSNREDLIVSEGPSSLDFTDLFADVLEDNTSGPEQLLGCVSPSMVELRFPSTDFEGCDSRSSFGSCSNTAKEDPESAACPTPEDDLCFSATASAAAAASPRPVLLGRQPSIHRDSSAKPALGDATRLAANILARTLSTTLPPRRADDVLVTRMGKACRVEWPVDARKLGGLEAQVSSPPVVVSIQPGAEPVTLILTIRSKSGVPFQEAQGIGSIHLECSSDHPEDKQVAASVGLSVGSGMYAQPVRGPTPFCLGPGSAFGLPEDRADWDFNAAVDASSMTFVVGVWLS